VQLGGSFAKLHNSCPENGYDCTLIRIRRRRRSWEMELTKSTQMVWPSLDMRPTISKMKYQSERTTNQMVTVRAAKVLTSGKSSKRARNQ